MNPDIVKAAEHLVDLAFREDLGPGTDATSETVIPREAIGSAKIVSRQPGIACGLSLIPIVIERFKSDVDAKLELTDGATVSAGTLAATLTGNALDLLKTERTLLNFMGKLSGIASLTHQFIERVKHTSTRIYDTRKTTPGWRHLEKYAVQCGGGTNHRMGLYDAVLIKDNHLAVIGNHAAQQSSSWIETLSPVIKKTREQSAHLAIQIEVDTISQLEQVLPLAPDIVLLDNMNHDQLRQAVELRDCLAIPGNPRIELEASGNINLETVKPVAETGIDRISVGAITHSAVNFDWGMDWS
ncbi:MAG: carboxylating nicotinate-nucleotide diphosphorylase [Planctomycetota bacterium]|nr:carboxylating nicotinate-nucleotide diphosphorylase [Planctomycetota bacterium]